MITLDTTNHRCGISLAGADHREVGTSDEAILINDDDDNDDDDDDKAMDEWREISPAPLHDYTIDSKSSAAQSTKKKEGKEDWIIINTILFRYFITKKLI